MNKKLYLLPIIALVFSFAFISCGDDDDGDPAKSTTEYLTSGTWNVTAMSINPGINFGSGTITDFYAFMDACEKDDLITFNSNGTITDDEGATKCDPSDPQTSNDGTWTFDAATSKLTISYPNEDPITLTISSINDSNMNGSYTVEEDFGAGMQTYTFSMTMTKV